MTTIYGVHAIQDAIKTKRARKIYIGTNLKNESLIQMIKESGIVYEFVDRKKLCDLSKTDKNQGVVAEVSPYSTFSLEELITSTKEKKDSMICILDEISDPHNLGAILRSADIFNIEGIIFKKHNSVPLNETVAKVSCGAINYVKCYEVTNISRTIEKLKENGFWIIGLDGEGQTLIQDVFKDRPLVIIIGAEGKGISRLVKQNCDLLVKIPQFGNVPCLNASNAAAIAFYELRRK